MKVEKGNIVIGIDIGSYTTKVCVVRHFKKDFSPKVISLFEVLTEGVFKGNILDDYQEYVADTIYTVFKKISPEILQEKHQIVISLNVSGISSSIQTHSILNNQINNLIEDSQLERLEKEARQNIEKNLKNKQILHECCIKYRIDHQEIDTYPLGMFGKKIEAKFLYIFCPTNYINKIENLFEKLKINIDDTISGQIAEGRVLLEKKDKIFGIGILNIGHSTTGIAVYENGNIILNSVIGIGSNDITNDISIGLQCGLKDAEEIKRGISKLSYSKRKLTEIIEARIEEICIKINLELEKINKVQALPGGFILTGQGSKLLNIQDYLKYYLKLPISFSDENIKKNTNNQIQDSFYARVYGSTFFAPSAFKKYKLNNFFSWNFIKNLFKKILP